MKQLCKTIGVLLMGIATLMVGAVAIAEEPGTISSQTLAARLASGPAVTVLDVRTAEEFASGHVPGALNIPYDQIEQHLAELEKARNSDIVAYCRSGRRTGIALETLKAKGFTHLLHLEGDLPAWQDGGHPIEAAN